MRKQAFFSMKAGEGGYRVIPSDTQNARPPQIIPKLGTFIVVCIKLSNHKNFWGHLLHGF